MENDNIASPLVSIITAVYNGDSYITNTVNSILEQTHNNIELIVVDDASTDKTAAILSKFASKPKIIIIKNDKNIGAAASRNIGYRFAKGHLIKFLDGDDLINPEAISEQVKLAIANQNSIISGKWGRFYNNDITTFKLNPEECWQTLRSIDWICSSWRNAQSMTNPGIFLIPRKIIDKAGLWDESLSLLDDLDYFTRTILTADKVIFCKNATLYYRSGVVNSLSGTKTRKGYESAYLSIKKATETLLNKNAAPQMQLVCANMWRVFLFDIYPNHPHLSLKVKNHLKSLPKSTIKFPSGGFSKLLLPLLGWRLVKILQNIKAKFQASV